MISFMKLYYVPLKLYFMVFIFKDVVLVLGNDLCWPFNYVPFKINPEFTPYQRNYIKEQISKINKNTCLYWSDKDESESVQNLTTFVRFERPADGPCEARVIYPDCTGWCMNWLVRLPDHCFAGRYVLHEIIHTLGFDHEQQRVDRDCYVWVSEDVKASFSYKVNPRYAIPNMDRFPYDKHSVMHYRRSGVLKALSERFYEWEPLGNEEERLTELDLWKIQYRFCDRPHYCEVYHQRCREFEKVESELNCVVKK